jgi:hypothetical protein
MQHIPAGEGERGRFGDFFSADAWPPNPYRSARINFRRRPRRASAVNCYVQQAPPEQPRGDPAMLVRAPGISVVRRHHEDRGARLREVRRHSSTRSPATRYKVAITARSTCGTGTAISGTGPVRVTANATKLWCARQRRRFTSDGATVAQITDPDFTTSGGGADPCYSTEYIAFRRPGTRSFFPQASRTRPFDALDIASANGSPGNLVGMIATIANSCMVKEFSTELWYNAANQVGSPSRDRRMATRNSAAPRARASSRRTTRPIMLASDKHVPPAAGRVDANLATRHRVDAAAHDDASLIASRCRMSRKATLFVAFTFASEGRTLVVDFTTGEWHERESMNSRRREYGSWRVQAIASATGSTVRRRSRLGENRRARPGHARGMGRPASHVVDVSRRCTPLACAPRIGTSGSGSPAGRARRPGRAEPETHALRLRRWRQHLARAADERVRGSWAPIDRCSTIGISARAKTVLRCQMSDPVAHVRARHATRRFGGTMSLVHR